MSFIPKKMSSVRKKTRYSEDMYNGNRKEGKEMNICNL